MTILFSIVFCLFCFVSSFCPLCCLCVSCIHLHSLIFCAFTFLHSVFLIFHPSCFIMNLPHLSVLPCVIYMMTCFDFYMLLRVSCCCILDVLYYLIFISSTFPVSVFMSDYLPLCLGHCVSFFPPHVSKIFHYTWWQVSTSCLIPIFFFWLLSEFWDRAILNVAHAFRYCKQKKIGLKIHV